MTASSLPCSPNNPERCWRRPVREALLALLLMLHAVVHAAPELRNVALVAADDGQQLQFDLMLDLNPRLEDVVSRGVPLYFVA